MDNNGPSKCSRKAALSIFFFIELLAFTLSLIAYLSPSWQYVYLENGRTEHHHGLWLDCKRDYSYDYGRDRSYYETLYRRDFQGSPFEMFILPPLDCVYKFDYYIDPEDLYDHNHDENRLQDDAYQHLFLGHKIATLSALGVALLMSMAGLLLGICSYCHRTFITASTVLVTIAAILSTIGIGVFYIWANYQDNKEIKELDDKDPYEQYLGWAFYFQLFGTLLYFLASMLGCCATSISFQKSRAKLVRIDVVEGGSANSDLLSHPHDSTSNFKRSFSAIYRVDSTALRQWEHDYMKRVKGAQQQMNNTAGSSQEIFKRTASMPMLTKKQRKAASRHARASVRASHAELRASSSSNLFSDVTETTGTTNTMESFKARKPPSIPTPEPPKQPLKSALKTPQASRKNLNESAGDTSYEYLPCDVSSTGVSSFLAGRTPSKAVVYDPVYERLPGDHYLEPNSVKFKNSTSTLSEDEKQKKALLPTMPISGSAQSIPTQKTTVIDDVILEERPSTGMEITRIRERQTIEELERMELIRRRQQPLPPKKPSFPVKPQTPPKPTLIQDTIRPPPPPPAEKPKMDVRDFGIALSTPPSNGYLIRDSESTPTVPSEICINTFVPDPKGSNKSLTNLTFRPGVASGSVDVFERPDSVDLTNGSVEPKKSTNLYKRTLIGSMPDEVDRSVGSSTLLENETIRDSPLSYARDAEVRLNLFMRDSPRSSSPYSEAPPRLHSLIAPSSSSKPVDNNETTV